jgi:hypothetical protein
MLADREFDLPPDHIVLFVHVPKTGGTSLVRFFTDLYGPERCFRHRARDPKTHELGPPMEKMTDHQRETVRFVAGHKAYGFHALFDRPALYITVVRDPVDRLLSDYWFNRRRGAPERRELTSRLTLDQYLEHKLAEPNSKIVRDGQVRWIAGNEHATIEDAKMRIDNDYFLACEVSQLDDMMRTLGVVFDRPFEQPPRLNVSNGDRTDALSASYEQLCREVNAGDVELCQYVHGQFRECAARLGVADPARASNAEARFRPVS